MIKIHYHSECAFFAGCESMLANFFNSEAFRRTHILSFSYVYSLRYEEGLNCRVILKLPMYALRFPSFRNQINAPQWMPFLAYRVFMATVRLILAPLLLLYQLFFLFALFKKINPDILHINNGGYPAARSALVAAIAGKFAGVPKVIMVVNNMAEDYWHYSRWLGYPMDKIVIKCVDSFITGSYAAGARLQKVLKLPKSQLKAIHNGIALRGVTCSAIEVKQRLGLNKFNGVIFGVVALLIPRKGHQVLLQAILKIVSDNHLKECNFKVLIEGSGPLYPELVKFVIDNKLSSWIEFVGEEENVVNFMSALDVLILPSVENEDFPNVILEAMALGKPVIASQIAGTPEQIVEGVTGLLVSPRNAGQLADAILRLIDCESMRISMGRASLDRYKDLFTSQIALNNYSDFYAKLIKEVQ